jgi:hypothetical protein
VTRAPYLGEGIFDEVVAVDEVAREVWQRALLAREGRRSCLEMMTSPSARVSGKLD